MGLDEKLNFGQVLVVYLELYQNQWNEIDQSVNINLEPNIIIV
jgi:hypothetical protein